MSTRNHKFTLKDKFYMEIPLDLSRSRHGLTGSNPSDNSKIEEEVKNEVISLTSSFPIYKNL